MDLKRRFTFFKSKRVDEALEVCSTDQILGQKIGSVDVQCTFKARESRWTTKSETELHGLLLFNIQFTDYSNTPLRTAIITIDVDAFDSKGPKFVIDESAPINPITGPAIEQSIRDDKKFDPDIGAGVGPGSFNASGVSYEKETETTAVHRWTFNSGFPSQKQGTRIYKAGFFWTRTLLADRSGTRRSYEGALVVNCSKEYTTPLSLDVQVKIKPWHRHHSFLNGGSRRKKSEPVGPSEKSLTSRETLLPTPYEDLQSYMKWRNSRLAPTQVESVRKYRESQDELRHPSQESDPVARTAPGRPTENLDTQSLPSRSRIDLESLTAPTAAYVQEAPRLSLDITPFRM